MKWLALPFVVVAALVVAVWLMIRARRGRPVRLAPGRSPGFLRMVAVLLVLLVPMDADVNADEPAGDEPVAPVIPGEWPAGVDAAAVARWRASARWSSDWTDLKRAYTQAMLASRPAAGAPDPVATVRRLVSRVPHPIGEMLVALVEHRSKGEALPAYGAAALLRALAALEADGAYDPWYAGFLWRASARSPGDDGRVELYAALRRHLRISLTLARAHVDARAPAFAPRAWMSKAGPSREDREREDAAVNRTLEFAKRLYAEQDAGPWDRECRVGLGLAPGSPAATFVGPGAPRPLGPGDSVRVGRLCAIVAGENGAVFVHAHYGNFTLASARAHTAWELGDGADAAARAQIDLDVASALAGDEDAALRLERAFALVHRSLRTALAAKPESPGAPRLRTLMALFDDEVAGPR